MTDHTDRGLDLRQEALSRKALRAAAVEGARWMVGVRIAGELLALGFSIALARLVAPAEFGFAAVALLFPMLSVVLSYQGFGAFLVQRGQMDQDYRATAEFLGIAAGILLAAAMFLTAPLWADPLFGQRTADLIQMTSPVFALAGLGVVPRADLQRRLAFRLLGTFEVLAFTAGSTVAVVCAVAGLGADALIIGALTTTTTNTLLMVASEGPTRPYLVPSCAVEILSFGVAASLAGFTNVARRNIDYVILTAMLPAASVGYYLRAFQLGAEYQGKLSGILLRLAFPLFSRAQNVADMKVLRSRVVSTNVMLIFPLLALLVVIAPYFVPWAYGARWTPAVEPAQILAVSGMSLAVLSGTEPLLLAAGRPRLLLAFNAVFLVVTGIAVLLAAPGGIVVAAIAVAGVHLVLVVLAQILLVGRLVGVPVRQLLDDVLPGGVASGAVVAVGLLARPWVDNLGQPVIQMGVCLGAGLVIYVGVLRWLFAGRWKELQGSLEQVLLRPSRNPKLRAAEPPAPAEHSVQP